MTKAAILSFVSGSGAQSGDGKLVGFEGAIFLALLLVDLTEMVADFAMLAQSPGGGDIFFGLVEVAFVEINPPQRVPIGDERGHEGQFLLR